MSPLDAVFLHVEDDNNPMHIGSVAVFEGPPPTYGELVRTVAAKLPQVPRYRQRVRFVPFGAGRPVWIDDPHFNILYHVRRTAVPTPGAPEELRNLAGRVFGQRLDRAKPLWELWVVEGVEEGRWALISKVHHCMVDGVSGTDLMTVLFDIEPVPPPTKAPEFVPEPEPSRFRLLADTAIDAVVDPFDRVFGLPIMARANLAGFGLRELRNLAYTAGRFIQPAVNSLNGPIGPHRRWSWASATLEEVKTIRNAFGGTVNDVVLAVVTRGFRDLLLERGEEVEGRVVRSLVPVSVRTEAESGVYNNRVSALFPGLPVGVADPLERLEAIRVQMDGFKDSRQAVAGEVLTHLSGFAPALLLDLAARLAIRYEQRFIQTVTTNVPGPQFPLYVGGRQMVYAYPYVPIAATVRIGIAIFSYLGRLSFGVTADFDTVPDLDVLTAGIEAGLTELVELAGKPMTKAASAPPQRVDADGRRAGAPKRARSSTRVNRSRASSRAGARSS